MSLRARQPGDRFRPAGRGLSKPLRKWMNEAGIPPELRDTLPLLAAEAKFCGSVERALPMALPRTRKAQVLQMEMETQEEKTNEYAR